MKKFHKIPILYVYMTIILIGAVFAPVQIVRADVPPDQLESYTVSVSPQTDGSLIMNYALDNYCARSDWPTDIPYLQVGVPNGNFVLMEGWGPKDGANRVVKAEPINNGYGSFVQLDFDQGNLPKNGDCFNLNFSVTQSHMAYPDPVNGNVTFELIPAGWDFPIQVKTLILNWALPIDPALVKLTDPAPMTKDLTFMTWQWTDPQMDASSMFRGATIKLAYDKSAFTLPVEVQAPESVNTDDESGAISINPIAILFIVLILVVLVIGLGLLLNWGGSGLGSSGFGGNDSNYVPTPPKPRRFSTDRHESEKPRRREKSGPSYSPSRRSESPPYSPPPKRPDPPSSSGGGFGGSSGHSSGCVSMPSCACACACAGGGRVGCSRKGIGIKCLGDAIASIVAPRHEINNS